MIRLFKIFINLLYGAFTMGTIAIVVWGSNWLVNTGGESHDVPNLIINKNDDPYQTIYFSDVTDFNMLSVANAHKSHEIFLGNENTGEEYIMWGLVPVGWLNRTLTWTKNVIVAVTSPSYEMEQMDSYRYAMFVTKHPDLADKYVTIDSTEINVNNYNREEYNIHGIIYGSKDNPFTIGQEIDLEDMKKNGVFKDTLVNRDYFDFSFKNEVTKFDKYRGDDYLPFEKFLDNRPVAKWAFSEIIIIFALTVFVVYQNPIDFTRNERGVTEIDRTFLPKIPLPKRRVKKGSRRHREEAKKDYRY